MSDWDIDPPAKDASPRRTTSKDPPVSGEPQSPAGVAHDPQPARAPAATSSSASGGSDAGLSHGRGSKRISYAWLGVVVAALLVGLIGGYFIARSQISGNEATLADLDARVGELQAALAQSQDRNWSYYRANETLKQQLQQATSGTSSTTSPTDHGGVFSDGVYTVGKGIPAGTYDGVVNGSFGYWARLKGYDGSIAQIIENGLPRGPFVLTINPADDAVELRGVTLTER
jgi:hypothetical protein